MPDKILSLFSILGIFSCVHTIDLEFGCQPSLRLYVRVYMQVLQVYLQQSGNLANTYQRHAHVQALKRQKQLDLEENRSKANTQRC